MGAKILHRGGSAVDAAITTLLCEGVMIPHSLGLGGGFLAMIYTKKTGEIRTLISRETAPAAASRNMFFNKKITGALSSAVPSELYGYWRLHERYGKLPWRMLFEQSINLCTSGHKVSRNLANVIKLYTDRFRAEPSMMEILINPKTNDFFKEGDTMFRPKLAETLRIVSEEGPGAIYRGGRLGKMLAEDIQSMGGIITEEDLQNYDVRWEQPVVTQFASGYSLYSTPLPTSGIVLAYILKVLEPLYTDRLEIYWQRVIETFKHAYGHRTNLGDVYYEPQVQETFDKLLNMQFIEETRKLIKDDFTSNSTASYGANFDFKEDHGTANIAVLAPNGDAVLVTSTVNSHFGAKIRSSRTGIILNDEMDDFSTPGVTNIYGIPASPSNYIKPGKRPMSSACPTIILDTEGNVRLLVGGAGGAKITTAVAQAILRYFVLNESIADSIAAGRLHHQLAPMSVDVEPEVPDYIKNYLGRIGHKLNFLPENKAYSALTAIGLKNDVPEPVCDRRRMGSWVIVHPIKK